MYTFEHIAIVQKLDGATKSSKTTEKAIRSYAKSRGIPVHIYDSDSWAIRATVPTLLIAIGGDGTMLYAARQSLMYDSGMILGLNAGNLGFLTDTFTNEQLPVLLDAIRTNDSDIVKVDKRMVLEADFGEGEPFVAINEFHIGPLYATGLMRYHIDVNGSFLAEQSSSGLIISTPTGSTAFSVSAGGAIVNPTSRVMQITPVAAHALHTRPVILAGSDEIEITVPLTQRMGTVNLVADGQLVDSFSSTAGKYEINIRASKNDVYIWRPKDWNFFSVLSEKMGWK